jgi:hypothetical protein
MSAPVIHLVHEDSAVSYLDDRTAVADLTGGRRGNLGMSPIVADIIAKRVRAGQPDSEISEAIGLSVRGIGRYRARFGIPAAPSSWRPAWTTLTTERLRVALDAAAAGQDVEMVLARLLKGEAPWVSSGGARTS